MERKNHTAGFVPTEDFCEALTGGQPPVLEPMQTNQGEFRGKNLKLFQSRKRGDKEEL